MQIQPQPEWIKSHLPGALSLPVQLPVLATGFGQSGSAEVQSASAPEKSFWAAPDKKTAPVEKKKPDYGNASRWVTAYKLGFSLVVAGAANAFLFGVPLWWAAGLSAVVASAQSAIALKVHQEDTPFSKKVVAATRKIMHRDHDQTPAGKEWSMVPVWGVACGSMALVEAGFNHIYSKMNPLPHGVDPLVLRLEHIKQSIKKADRFQRLYELQKRGVEMTRHVKQWLQESFPDRLPPRLKSLNHALWQKLDKNVKGNPKAGYLVGFLLAAVGGVAQTSIAAKIQERIDAHQDTNPKALLGAMKDKASLKNRRGEMMPSGKAQSPSSDAPAVTSPPSKNFFGFETTIKPSPALLQGQNPAPSPSPQPASNSASNSASNPALMPAGLLMDRAFWPGSAWDKAKTSPAPGSLPPRSFGFLPERPSAWS